MYLVTVANILVIAAIAIQLYRRESTLRKLFWPALILKIIAGIALGFMYFEYYGLGDTIAYFNDSQTLAEFARRDLNGFLSFLRDGENSSVLRHLTVQEPRAIALTKIGSVFHLMTSGNYWMISAWFSFISFIATWGLVKEVVAAIPGIRSAAAFSFLFFPSVVFWSSGFIKESIAFATICFIVRCFLRIRNRVHVSLPGYAILVVAILMLWSLKYYYLIVLLPIVVADVIYERFVRSHLSKVNALGRGGIWFAIMLLPLVMAGTFHPNFHPSIFFQVVVDTHDAFIALSGPGDAITFHHLTPDVVSMIINAPLALVSGLYRPFIWESTSATGLLAALENLLLVFLTISALVSVLSKKNRLSHEAFLVILYCTALCIFLALSAPNFGSLSRYRVAFLPFLVMLLCYKNVYAGRVIERIF